MTLRRATCPRCGGDLCDACLDLHMSSVESEDELEGENDE